MTARPGDGQPLFHGVRVVELASILAAPSAARVFADLGADVVKIEGNGGAGNGGDPLRTVTLPYESSYRQQRGVGQQFECLHPGKKSLCIDVKTQRDKLVKVLSSADVLITNIREHQLKAMRIDFETISKELPHLVYAHITAWGNGKDGALPGYGTSSFTASVYDKESALNVIPFAFRHQCLLVCHGNGSYDSKRVDVRGLSSWFRGHDHGGFSRHKH